MFQLDLMVAVGMACLECLFVSDVPCCSLVLFIFFLACVLVVCLGLLSFDFFSLVEVLQSLGWRMC